MVNEPYILLIPTQNCYCIKSWIVCSSEYVLFQSLAVETLILCWIWCREKLLLSSRCYVWAFFVSIYIFVHVQVLEAIGNDTNLSGPETGLLYLLLLWSQLFSYW